MFIVNNYNAAHMLSFVVWQPNLFYDIGYKMVLFCYSN